MRTKIFKWIFWLTVSFLLVLTILLIVTPRLLNSDFIRAKIQTLVTEGVGAQLDFQNINLVYTPKPTLQINQIEFNLPETVNIKADRISLTFGLAKLISGGNLVDTLQLDKPRVRLNLQESLEPSPDPITEVELWEILSQIITPLIAYTPDLEIVLYAGSVVIADITDSPFSIHGIEATLTLNAEQEALRIELAGQLSNLAFKVNNTTTQLNVKNLSASTRLQAGQIVVKLNNLSLKQAELELNGDWTVARAEPKFNLRLASQVPDLIKLFPYIRPLLEEIEGSDQVFDSLLGGSVENISLQSEANDILGLFDFEVMKIDAHFEEGEFSLAKLAHKINNFSGRVHIADRHIELTDAHLESGQTFANIEKIAVYRKNKTAPFMLDIDNTRLHFNLAALHKNLYGFPAIKAQLDEIASVSGQLDVNMANLKGPLAEIADWKFKVTGAITETVIATSLFPAPIRVLNGSFSADERSIDVKEILLKSLDADLKVSGHIKGKTPVPTQIEASVTGAIGEKFNNWLRQTANLPEAYTIETPITIDHASLKWKSGNHLAVTGDFKPFGGPTISGDISFSPPKNIQIEVSISDQISNAKISALSKENNLKGSFSGNLQKETINNIFVKQQLSSGRIKGDFSLELARDNGIQIATSGKLQGENLLLPVDIKEPITISDFAVTGRDHTLGIDHLALKYGEESANIIGSIGSLEGNCHLDLDLHTGPLDLLKMIKQYEDIGEHQKREPDAEPGLISDIDAQPQDLPFRGRIGLNVEALNLAHLSIAPLRANIEFSPQKITVQAVQANLCGIDLLASAQLTPGEISLTLPINTVAQDLSEGSICLTEEQGKVTGKYDLKGMFTAKGAPEALMKTVQGNIVLSAHNGAIEQNPLVARILSVINLTEFYRDEYKTLDKSKLGYTTLKAEARLENKRLDIVQYHFDGTTLESVGKGYIDFDPATVNFELLVFPLKTFDAVVKLIPGVNYLLAGNLVSLPVQLSGPTTDLEVKMLPAGAVGRGVLGLAERVLEIPVKIVEPLRGNETEKERGTESP